MKFTHGRRRYNAQLMLGNLFLILGLLSQRLFAHAVPINGDLGDGISGLFIGLTLGCYFVGIRKMMRGGDSGSATA